MAERVLVTRFGRLPKDLAAQAALNEQLAIAGSLAML